MPVECEPASISEQHLKDAWQAQMRFCENAAALGTLKKNGSRPGYLREHVAEGLGVVQRLLGQSNTVHHINTFGRPDTQGGLVSVRMRPPLSRWHFRPDPPRQICMCCVVLCVRAVCETDCDHTVQVNLDTLLTGLGNGELLQPNSVLGATVRRAAQYDRVLAENASLRNELCVLKQHQQANAHQHQHQPPPPPTPQQARSLFHEGYVLSLEQKCTSHDTE